MSKFEQVENSNGKFLLSGSLDQKTVSKLWQQKNILVANDNKIVIDLSTIKHSDSAGLALLVCLQSNAKQSQYQLSYINIPQQLQQLITLNNLEDVLNCEQHL